MDRVDGQKALHLAFFVIMWNNRANMGISEQNNGLRNKQTNKTIYFSLNSNHYVMALDLLPLFGLEFGHSSFHLLLLFSQLVVLNCGPPLPLPRSILYSSQC